MDYKKSKAPTNTTTINKANRGIFLNKLVFITEFLCFILYFCTSKN